MAPRSRTWWSSTSPSRSPSASSNARDRTLVATAPLEVAADESIELEAVLLFDPTSIEVTGRPASVAHGQRAPAVPDRDADLHREVRRGAGGRAAARPAAAPRRTGGPGRVAHHRRRRLRRPRRRRDRAAPSRDRPARPRPAARRRASGPRHLDLPRRRREGDLRLDGVRRRPRRPRSRPARARRTLDGDVSEFATQIRRSIEFSGGATEDYFTLHGRAVQIGRSVPEGIQQAIRSVVGADGRTTAPAVLLLTEELVVPWELACLAPQAEHPVGRVVALPGGARRGLAVAARRAQAAAPPAPRRRRRLRRGADRRLHGRVAAGSAWRARSPRPPRSRPSSPRRRRRSRPSW